MTRTPSGAVWPTAAARGAGCSADCSARARSACSASCRRARSAPYLSGLLIGREIAEALDCLDEPSADQEITVIGSSGLTERYLTAIADAGLRGRRAVPEAAARGLYLIARAAGLVS